MLQAPQEPATMQALTIDGDEMDEPLTEKEIKEIRARVAKGLSTNRVPIPDWAIWEAVALAEDAPRLLDEIDNTNSVYETEKAFRRYAERNMTILQKALEDVIAHPWKNNIQYAYDLRNLADQALMDSRKPMQPLPLMGEGAE